MPVKRAPSRPASPSRRPAPSQARRTAAAQPAPRGRQAAAVAEQDEQLPFDGAGSGDQEDEYEDDELPEVIDLSDVQAATYEVIPRGVYHGWIDDVEYGLSQSKNLPMLTFICKFMYAPDEGEEERERTLRYYATLAGDGAGRTKALLAKLDPEMDMSAVAPGDMGEHFAGKEVKLRITIRPDREDPKIKRNNIADISPLEEGDFEE